LRRGFLLLALCGALLFVAASFLVARVVSAGSDERGAAVAVVKAQARGDDRAVLRLLASCARRPACAERVRRMVARLRRPGGVDVLNVRSPPFSLGARTGMTRIAWKVGTGLPLVQCVTAKRTGNPLRGYDIRLLALSAPIGREASC
jgi:hypothetical protein